MTDDAYSWARAMRDLRADLDRYRVTGGLPIWANLWLSPGTVASIHYRAAHWAWRARSPRHLAARAPLLLLQRFVEIWTGMSIAPQARIGPGLFIAHFGGVVIGTHAVIGSNVNLSQGVTIGVSGRGAARGTPVLGDRVYVGPGAMLFGPVTIGDDVAVGANAVVNRDVPARSVVGGVPAVVIGAGGSFDFVAYQGCETDPARLTSRAQVVPADRALADGP